MIEKIDAHNIIALLNRVQVQGVQEASLLLSLVQKLQVIAGPKKEDGQE